MKILNKIKNKIPHIIMIAMLLSTLAGCSPNQALDSQKNNTNLNIEENIQPGEKKGEKNTQSTSEIMKVHYIDVGQADSILIENNKEFTLIDAGNNDDGNEVVEYLKKQGVKKIDNLVLTHPHEDHIGGTDTVIKAFDIGKVHMPKVTANTKTFKDVVAAMQEKGIKATVPVVESTFQIGNATATILGPNKSEYKDLNNYSIVLRVVYGNTSFVFMGDAENESEKEILSKGFTVKADVLKLGHHGSSSSTSAEFLSKVSPKYAIISVGKNNDYGHPHKEIVDRLKGITTYRTDLNGTIVAVSNGEEISFNNMSQNAINNNGDGEKNTTPSSNGNSIQDKIYVDASGKGLIKGNISSSGEKIYHMPGGAYYDKTNAEELFKTEKEAQAAGYRKSQR